MMYARPRHKLRVSNVKLNTLDKFLDLDLKTNVKQIKMLSMLRESSK